MSTLRGGRGPVEIHAYVQAAAASRSGSGSGTGLVERLLDVRIAIDVCEGWTFDVVGERRLTMRLGTGGRRQGCRGPWRGPERQYRLRGSTRLSLFSLTFYHISPYYQSPINPGLPYTSLHDQPRALVSLLQIKSGSVIDTQFARTPPYTRPCERQKGKRDALSAISAKSGSSVPAAAMETLSFLVTRTAPVVIGTWRACFYTAPFCMSPIHAAESRL
ncbi:hypothetical protein M011DRAFT_503883 [Sporormia fimetaria CBS 119925]|uniref:Uncharacterized protein n=1 Tax=Sporormia fimetaria CBS 119925 TaxID=1340428 RepID=A0A6A6VPL5_9PLEO|nr:hypothetical protein M011DRAFT_503883 [Sporormia fimetaria CBS 119925]